MKVALEYLYHFRCDRCRAWWSQADIDPKPGDQFRCPRCGELNTVDVIQTFRDSARNSCLKVVPDKT
ncbi:MAG: hypothetical protein AAF268_03325 [Cyanobacteria bacterium P01_A01_bin.3]